MNHCIVIFTQVFWTVIAEKVLMTFSYKKKSRTTWWFKNQKIPVILAWLCNIQLVKISKMGFKGRRRNRWTTSGWGIDIHEVDWHPWGGTYGSLFPTMKTWLSFYTSRIVFLGFCGPIESTMCVFQNVVTVTELKRPWEVHLTYSPLTSRIPHECVNVSKLVDPATPTIVYFYSNTDNDR